MLSEVTTMATQLTVRLPDDLARALKAATRRLRQQDHGDGHDEQGIAPLHRPENRYKANINLKALLER
jgi:hypothetical protein